MKAQKIIEGLYSVKLKFVNAFLIVTVDEFILIDSGTPGSEQTILKAIEEIGKKPGDLDYIILTHAHPDHIGSASVLQKISDAEVYIHSIDAPIAIQGSGFRLDNLQTSPGLMNKLISKFMMGKVKKVEPINVKHFLNDQQKLSIAGGMKVIHVPGHCAGQVALLWESKNVVFMADTCTNIGELKLSPAYEDIEVGKESLNRLSKEKFEIACFGHGKPIMTNASEKISQKWRK